MDHRSRQAGPQSFEEYKLLFDEITQEYARAPEKIAATLRVLHQDSTRCARYVYAKAFEEILSGGKRTPGPTFHTACTTGLVEVLVEIALDPRIYVWHDPTSSYYHPQLGVSSIFSRLISVLNY